MPALILKVTERCNSNCVYCGNDNKRNGKTITDDTLDAVYRKIHDYLEANPLDEFEILWHGGEPLLPGPAFFEKAREYHDRNCPDTGDRISYGIQSNLTMLTEKYIEPLKKLAVRSIGTSFDPEPHMRGPGKNINSENYNRRFFRALSLLERNGFEYGIIYVVTARSLDRPLEIFHFLTNMVPSGRINFNPIQVDDGNGSDLDITPGQYADFVGAIFPKWWKNRSRYENIEPFKSVLDRVKLNMEGGRDIRSELLNSRFITMEPDGVVTQSGRPARSGPKVFGNIMEDSFDEILVENENYLLYDFEEKSKDEKCANCRFWNVCYGGCVGDAFSQNDRYTHKSEWCDSRRIFLEKYFEPITGITVERR